MTWREISSEQLNCLKSKVVIDVRSPCEHVEERIPGSVNVPLLSNDERATVGTIYKEQGEMVARRHALTIISPKIPALIDEISNLRVHGQAIVVYCWRGGLRSESVSSVLSIAGIDCHRLTGGYKAWRGQVLKDFAADAYPFEAVVLHGLTGVGKTEILDELGRLGAQVLDLEGIANHRGSVFGGLGMGDQPTQKNFDGEVWQRLRELKPGPVFVEAESRKVGKIAVPDCVFDRIHGRGISALVTGTVEKRAERIAADYLNPRHNPETELDRALQILGHLKERLGTKLTHQIRDLVAVGQVIEAVKLLLTEYYDPLYVRQIEESKPFAIEVDGDDVGNAAAQLLAWSKLHNQEHMPVPKT